MGAKELYAAGDLGKAIAAQGEEVKKRPKDLDARWFLAELCCAAGELERADTLLEAIAGQAIERAPTVALFRQLVRGETRRQQLFVEGRAPDFLAPPNERLRTQLQASIHVRKGELAEAARLLERAEELRPALGGTCDEVAFDDLRDLDDLIGGALEVLTPNGKYTWIALEDVESIAFAPPKRPRDLVWREAEVSVRGGPKGTVYVPVVYAPRAAGDADDLALARRTDWSGGDGAPVRGKGQRAWLAGEECRPILEIGRVEVRGS